MNRLALFLSLMAGMLGLGEVARAETQRFALIVGNDRGRADEQPLRYAGADAEKVYGVLRDLGGFAPQNMVLLRNEDAATVRAALIDINDRIRSLVAVPGDQALLFVYYSGHADAQHLHLGPSELRLQELAQLVRGSSATFRLLVLDACRSGALTRVKGGTIEAPFAILPERDELSGEGLALLTASSATEDAQESDELGGSLFTHSLVSGLIGAADVNGDGAVVLEEAYQHAYDNTLRLTSRTQSGLQHPTFAFDYRGQGQLVLTMPQRHGGRRGLLHLPAGLGFLVLRDDADGPVVGELAAGDRARTLSLPAGHYFLRGREQDHLLEGKVTLHADQLRAVDADELERVAYGRLVRKGTPLRGVAHALEAGLRLRSALPNATRACPGVFAGYALDLTHFSLLVRAGGCLSGIDNAYLQSADVNEADVELRALRAFDLPFVTLHVGAGLGGAVFMQRFESAGRAPDRDTLAFVLHLAAGASLPLTARSYVALDLSAQTYVFALRDTVTGAVERQAALALRSALSAGLRF